VPRPSLALQACTLQRQVATLQQEVSALRSAHVTCRTPNQPRAQMSVPCLQHMQAEATLPRGPLAAAHTTLLPTTAEHRSLVRSSEAAVTASQPWNATPAHQQVNAAALHPPLSATTAHHPLHTVAAHQPLSAVTLIYPGGGMMAPSLRWAPTTPSQARAGVAPSQPLNAALLSPQAWQDLARGSLDPLALQQPAAPAGGLCAGGRSSAQRVPPLPNSLLYTGGPAASHVPRAPSGQAAGSQQGPGPGVP
jgi:hypothetical protein